MKTIVLQSFRTRDVPDWIGTCMASVRAWAAASGWEYAFMDDDFFALTPDWARWRCRDNLYAVTDISRLAWARRALDQGYERAIWADADMLVFAPAALKFEPGRGHGVARQLFLSVGPEGATTPIMGMNNAMMLFERGDALLDEYLAACYACLRALPPGPVPRTALGPDLLKRMGTERNLGLIEGVGLFSPALMEDIAAGGGPLWREYLQLSTCAPAAANLCLFLRHVTRLDLRPTFDHIYDTAIARLFATCGAVYPRPA